MVYIGQFNKSNWREFEVEKPEQAPKGQHYAAVLFGSHVRDDGWGGTYHQPNTTYYAFPDISTLRLWVAEAQGSSQKFFFFEVKQLGTLEVKVDVGV